jgi:GrpB-like predicted nucleotidyltransferase (UPF0157 family)
MLGLKRGTVKLSPHREDWHQSFVDEKRRILYAIGEHVVSIEHVGSTAICGIAAKPIIDLMAGIERFEDGDKCVRGLEDLGYEYKQENGVPGRHYFGKGTPRTHHLHMVAVDGDFWVRHLLFRNYLRANRQAAADYNDLKLSLADRFPNDRGAYTNGKESFVTEVLRNAARPDRF